MMHIDPKKRLSLYSPHFDEMRKELYLCAEFSAQLEERMDRLRSMIPETHIV